MALFCLGTCLPGCKAAREATVKVSRGVAGQPGISTSGEVDLPRLVQVKDVLRFEGYASVYVASDEHGAGTMKHACERDTGALIKTLTLTDDRGAPRVEEEREVFPTPGCEASSFVRFISGDTPRLEFVSLEGGCLLTYPMPAYMAERMAAAVGGGSKAVWQFQLADMSQTSKDCLADSIKKGLEGAFGGLSCETKFEGSFRVEIQAQSMTDSGSYSIALVCTPNEPLYRRP
jgi:hypothetical protein